MVFLFSQIYIKVKHDINLSFTEQFVQAWILKTPTTCAGQTFLAEQTYVAKSVWPAQEVGVLNIQSLDKLSGET